MQLHALARSRLLLSGIITFALTTACSGSDATLPGVGGGNSIGGTLATGGKAATTGGQSNVVGNGGNSPSGGAATGGLNNATGGAPNATGGAQPTGGAVAIPTGGTPATGGSKAVATGGTPAATGGSKAAATGGTTTTPATGGTKATGGATASPTGGTKATGGATSAATGGTPAAGGASTNLKALVKAMAPGWNLGNSFDGNPTVTSWGNPAPNQTLIKAVKAAGFNSIRIPVTWTDHIGAAPSYTIDSAWMASVVQTAQWAIDAGLYAFVNTHHEADKGPWVSFPADPTPVVAEVTAVWAQIATAFKAFDSKLMLECFNEPNGAGGGATAQAMTDLNQYLVACVNAIRGTGGANATRVVMIQGIGASPSSSGINSVLKISVINDPNLIFSVHTYQPTNFGLSTTPYAWGSASDYTGMTSSVTQILGWLPNWGIVIGEWGSMGGQALANRVTHAYAYSRDTAAAGMCPMWWDNGGSGTGSYAIFNRTTGAQTQPTIVNAIVTGTQKGLANPGVYSTLANP